MNEETIMPDGRPLFAWKNELAMLRAKESYVKDAELRLAVQMKLMHIASIEHTNEPWSGDMIFRLRRMDMVLANDIYGAIDKVTLEKPRTPHLLPPSATV